jgi:hypothetical protein
MPKFHRLQALSNLAASFVALLTANWPVAVSVAIGLVTASSAGLRAVALNPVTYVGVGTFLAVLWTFIGIVVLMDRRRPRLVRSAVDYRYGLVFEGLVPQYLSATDNYPNAGCLQFSINIRNFSLGPMRCRVEDIDIRIGSRASPRLNKAELGGGVLPRGAGRSIKPPAFSPEHLREFYGMANVEGTADFSIVYGHPDSAPERRLRMTLVLYLEFANDGSRLGHTDNITADYDEPI